MGVGDGWGGGGDSKDERETQTKAEVVGLGGELASSTDETLNLKPYGQGKG